MTPISQGVSVTSGPVVGSPLTLVFSPSPRFSLIEELTIAHSFRLRKKRERALEAVNLDLSQAAGAGDWKKVAISPELMVGTWRERERPRWRLNNVVQQLPGQLLAGCGPPHPTPPQGALLRKFITKTNRPYKGPL